MAAVTAAVAGTAATVYSANRQKKAASEAAKQQRRAGGEAIAAQQAAQAQLREDLAPFASGLGTELLPQAQQLFGPSAFEAVKQDPVLQAIQEDAERKIMASQAARGRLGAGETPEQLQEAFTRSSLGFLGQQRSDLLNALRLGQASAAQVGAAGMQTGSNIANLLTQIGNVRAAGTIGQQQAQAQALQNVAGLGGSLLGAIRQAPLSARTT